MVNDKRKYLGILLLLTPANMDEVAWTICLCTVWLKGATQCVH